MPRRNNRRSYPRTVAEILDDQMSFRRATVQAVLRLKRSRPWSGSERERKRKLRRLHRTLCRIYDKRTGLGFGLLDGACSGRSGYDGFQDVIILRGRLSVTTYLHEFGHALCKGERGACRWSVNLFRLCFPREFAACWAEGHMLRRVRQEGRHRRLDG